VHPDVLAAIAAANDGHVSSYGHDGLSERVQARLAAEFGPEAQAFIVFNGSAANVLCLRAACRPWQAAICADGAHLNVDEGGAPELIAGVKLLEVPAPEGRLTPESIAARIERIGDEHAVQPRVVSVTQSTELGTVYEPGELRAIAELAHSNGLVLHVDGARLGNAAAALDCSLAEAAAGADIISFGGTKNGLLLGEAVVIVDPELGAGFAYLRKQTLQLASKMRFISAQFDAYLDDELWRRTASHANAMAARLAAAVDGVPGLELTQRPRANGVFARLPGPAIAPLQERFPFHVWDQTRGVVRWVCSWDTTPEDVDAFAAAIRETLGGETRAQ
jgi:threonine aldolase